MKRALALAAILSLGVMALAQIESLSGYWWTKIKFLSTVEFKESRFKLDATIAGIEVSSFSKFKDTGFVLQEFSGSLDLGPTTLDWVMGFNPAATDPDLMYGYTDVTASMSFAGVDISASIFHGVYPFGADEYFDWTYTQKGKVQIEDILGYDPIVVPADCTDELKIVKWIDKLLTFKDVWEAICDDKKVQTGSTLMFYAIEADVSPVHVQVRFGDCCEGIEFYDFYLSLDNLSLCCGLSYDFDLYFTKEGFEWARFVLEVEDVICCGIDMKIETTFTVDEKKVSVDFDWGGFAGCFDLYGDVVWDGSTIQGYKIYGWHIYCGLGDCTAFEILTALAPDVFAGKYAISLPGGTVYLGPLFKQDEFQYIGFCWCGPACCGGEWSFKARAFFDSGGGLFGFSRLWIQASVPLMDSLTTTIELELPDGDWILVWKLSF